MIVVKVGQQRTSFHGGIYKRCMFKDISENSIGTTYIFDCYLEHTRSARFWPYIKEQAMFDNINVRRYNNKNVVDGESEFRYLGQRHG